MLSGNGVTAFADGNRVVTTGTIESVSIADPGLSTQPLGFMPGMPALSPPALGVLTGLIVILAVMGLRRRRRR